MKTYLREVLKIFGKGIIGGLGVLFVISVAGIVYAVNSGGSLTADMWNNRNAPDYDSGWVAANVSNSTYNFNHNFGKLPSNYIIYISPTNDDSWAKIVPTDSAADQYNSPESSYTTDSNIVLTLYSGDSLIYCDSTFHPCYDGATTPYSSGYIKVVAWK